MSPLLSVLFAVLATIKPEDIAALIAEAVAFIDPLIAQRGIVLRMAWRILKPLLTSSSLITDVQGLLSSIKDHPNVSAAITASSFPIPAAPSV